MGTCKRQGRATHRFGPLIKSVFGLTGIMNLDLIKNLMNLLFVEEHGLGS